MRILRTRRPYERAHMGCLAQEADGLPRKSRARRSQQLPISDSTGGIGSGDKDEGAGSRIGTTAAEHLRQLQCGVDEPFGKVRHANRDTTDLGKAKPAHDL